ncbi:MAG: aldo/keto reductase [Anaerolineae bacterium]
MQYRNLGRTGLQVSELCLGTMQWGWTASEEASWAVMDAFVAAGGNFIDTADVYSRWAEGNPGGVAEEIIGRWMKERGNRRQIVLATKVRGVMWDGPNGEGLSRGHIMTAVRGQPAPPADRPHRPVPDPLVRRRHAHRRDAARAG